MIFSPDAARRWVRRWSTDAMMTETSHELRTPLTALRGALGLLTGGKIAPDTQQGQQLLQIATSNVERLMRLTMQIEGDTTTHAPMISPDDLERLRLENELFTAWNHGDFELFYQPIIDCQTQELVGFEALLRWRHPTRGYIEPMVFIPVLEGTPLLHEVGLWVMETTCQQLQAWQQATPARSRPLLVSLNWSPLQLVHPQLVNRMLRILCKYTLAPQTLAVEITESTVIEHPSAIATLKKIREAGLKIFLDDFGTGYSCLARLHQFPIDVLKIDRLFVSQGQWETIRGIFHLAQSLGLEVITEGIETEQEQQCMAEIGSHWAQGFRFSAPLNAAAATALLMEETAPVPVGCR
jgi:EAL domain-containing protein (putative c-di-GMP-specific phosphodiesterase class I)